MHPIYGALLRRPDVMVSHVGNYVELAKEEAGSVVQGVAVRAAAGATAGVAVLLALGLTGFAGMLGALYAQFVWALVVVPGIAWVIGAVGLFVALRPTQTEVVHDFKTQVEADVTALRVAGEMK